jgi:hypothetical protein
MLLLFEKVSKGLVFSGRSSELGRGVGGVPMTSIGPAPRMAEAKIADAMKTLS